MECTQLLTRLEENGYHYHIHGNRQLNPDLVYMRFLTGSYPSYSTSILYLTNTDLLPEPDLDSPIVIFCLGQLADDHICENYEKSDFQLVFFDSDTSLGELTNFIMECLSEIQRFSAGMHILIDALFSGNGLQYLVDTATNLFGNPIYVFDLQYKYLAMSAGIIPENVLINTESRAGYVSESGIQYILKNKLNEKSQHTDQSLYHYNNLILDGMLLDTIYIQDIEVGHVMMLESEHAFRDFDKDFFHRFSKLISMELQKDSVFRKNKGVMYSYFLADLIRHPEKNTEEIKHRLKIIGYDLQDAFYIIAIPSIGHSTSDLRMEVILEQMRFILSKGIYVIYEDTIVFLISRKLEQNIDEYEMEQLESFLKANNLKAGVSNFFQDLAETPLFYQQAVSSVLLGVELDASASVYYFSDYYLYKMLENYEKSDLQLRLLIQPGLMKLYLYDKEHHTDFMETIMEFLKYPGQPALIAENLHIHKNTLLYRMGKIKQIVGCDFIEGEEYMNYQLSVKIMKYLRMI